MSNKYLTNNGIITLKKQLYLANNELNRISLKYPLGSGTWRQQKRYIDGLELLLDKECIDSMINDKAKNNRLIHTPSFLLTDNCFKKFDKLMKMIKDEHNNQIRKWGIQTHTPFEWLTYTTEELGELSKAISEFEYRNGTKEKIIKEAIQTATLSLKIAEMYME